MDETPLFMNIPNTKMIVKIGSKEVNIKVHRKEWILVIAILWIVADGTKLPQCYYLKVNQKVELREYPIKIP